MESEERCQLSSNQGKFGADLLLMRFQFHALIIMWSGQEAPKLQFIGFKYLFVSLYNSRNRTLISRQFFLSLYNLVRDSRDFVAIATKAICRMAIANQLIRFSSSIVLQIICRNQLNRLVR